MAWYLVSPLFINRTVNENIPLNNGYAETYQGSFTGADSFHKVEGTAKILSTDDKVYLSLENFKSTNGPDLKVYLSEDKSAISYINLGELKGNIGNQNYEIPEGTDLSKYKYALIWCEQFSVLFGSAELDML